MSAMPHPDPKLDRLYASLATFEIPNIFAERIDHSATSCPGERGI